MQVLFRLRERPGHSPWGADGGELGADCAPAAPQVAGLTGASERSGSTRPSGFENSHRSCAGQSVLRILCVSNNGLFLNFVAPNSVSAF